MKSFVAAATLLSVAQGIVALTINTPTNVVVCEPIMLTWSDGTPPYYLSIIPGGQPSAASLKTFPTQEGTSLTWNVDLQGSITISLKDSTGTQAYSDIINISGSDTSCINSNSTSTDVSNENTSVPSGGNTATSGGSTTAAGAGAGATTTGGAAASNTAAGASRTTSASVAKSTTTGANASTKSNAASQFSVGAYGLAGVMALVGLAAL